MLFRRTAYIMINKLCTICNLNCKHSKVMTIFTENVSVISCSLSIIVHYSTEIISCVYTKRQNCLIVKMKISLIFFFVLFRLDFFLRLMFVILSKNHTNVIKKKLWDRIENNKDLQFCFILNIIQMWIIIIMRQSLE